MRLGARGQLVLLSAALILPAIFAADLYLTPRLEELLHRRIRADLLVRLELIEREASSRIVSLDAADVWRALATDFARRSNVEVTIVDTGLHLLGDSRANATAEVAAAAPELVTALNHGFGQSTRPSPGHGQRMFFVAVPFRWEDTVIGAVRLGIPVAELDQAVAEVRWTVRLGWTVVLLAGGIAAAALVQLLSRRVRRLTRTARRMAHGDLSARSDVGGRDELFELGATLEQLADGLAHSFADLTAERDLVRRLEANRRDYVANVSHELKTPLTAILSATDSLRSGALRDPAIAAEFTEIIARNGERLRQLVEDVLELARVESGQLQLVRRPLPLAPAVALTADRFREAAQKRGVSIDTVVVPPEAWVLADPRAFDQLLGNLLGNAVRWAPAGGTVTIRAHAEEPGIRVAVEDQGPGIDPAHHARIFDRFYRVQDSRSREEGGSGLGLAIVKQLAEAMGGAVGLSSAPGRGSSFWFSLPRAP